MKKHPIPPGWTAASAEYALDPGWLVRTANGLHAFAGPCLAPGVAFRWQVLKEARPGTPCILGHGYTTTLEEAAQRAEAILALVAHPPQNGRSRKRAA